MSEARDGSAASSSGGFGIGPGDWRDRERERARDRDRDRERRDRERERDRDRREGSSAKEKSTESSKDGSLEPELQTTEKEQQAIRVRDERFFLYSVRIFFFGVHDFVRVFLLQILLPSIARIVILVVENGSVAFVVSTTGNLSSIGTLLMTPLLITTPSTRTNIRSRLVFPVKQRFTTYCVFQHIVCMSARER